MPRINPNENANVPAPLNIYKTMAVSPTFLEGFLAFGKTVSGGSLSEELREKIALTAAGINNCDYCKSAHSKLATKAGISEEGIEYALQGKCGDPKIDAALKFVTALIEKRGHIDEADFNAVKDAGYTDQEIIDIFGQTMVNMVTNYFNDFIQMDVDV